MDSVNCLVVVVVETTVTVFVLEVFGEDVIPVVPAGVLDDSVFAPLVKLAVVKATFGTGDCGCDNVEATEVVGDCAMDEAVDGRPPVAD